MSGLSERDQLFRSVPGPSPWYLNDKLVPIEGFSWKLGEKDKREAVGCTTLQNPFGTVGIL